VFAAMGGLPKMLRNGPIDDLKTIARHIQVLPGRMGSRFSRDDAADAPDAAPDEPA